MCTVQRTTQHLLSACRSVLLFSIDLNDFSIWRIFFTWRLDLPRDFPGMHNAAFQLKGKESAAIEPSPLNLAASEARQF